MNMNTNLMKSVINIYMNMYKDKFKECEVPTPLEYLEVSSMDSEHLKYNENMNMVISKVNGNRMYVLSNEDIHNENLMWNMLKHEWNNYLGFEIFARLFYNDCDGYTGHPYEPYEPYTTIFEYLSRRYKSDIMNDVFDIEDIKAYNLCSDNNINSASEWLKCDIFGVNHGFDDLIEYVRRYPICDIYKLLMCMYHDEKSVSPIQDKSYFNNHIYELLGDYLIPLAISDNIGNTIKYYVIW